MRQDPTGRDRAWRQQLVQPLDIHRGQPLMHLLPLTGIDSAVGITRKPEQCRQ